MLLCRKSYDHTLHMSYTDFLLQLNYVRLSHLDLHHEFTRVHNQMILLGIHIIYNAWNMFFGQLKWLLLMDHVCGVSPVACGMEGRKEVQYSISLYLGTWTRVTTSCIIRAHTLLGNLLFTALLVHGVAQSIASALEG